MVPGRLPDHVPNEKITFGTGFASEPMEIGIEGIFGRLWSRDGLARRDRSLVTLGILIALGAEQEMESHFQIALQNGPTEDELAGGRLPRQWICRIPGRQHRQSGCAAGTVQRPRAVVRVSDPP